ncbi:uncharacterized protein LOC127712748 [Mytilus californianus]|uniref:uncharacterized protein LOC127712748 n=1 Tax=Mytilus californianus TaxID=6549 RepID=UPI0022455B50|nr:uncharacterized protein LOC127712748 [Mytilus californianus]
MLINSMKEELNCHVNEFQEFLSSQKTAPLLYKESDLLSVMKSFGSVEIKETPFDIKYKPFKAQKAQFLQQQRKLPTKFKLDTKFKVPGANVIGIGVTKDNRLFLCDRTGSKLFVMSDKGKQLAATRMDGRPWGIAMDEDKHTAWVTLPNTPCVQTVDIVKMEKGRLIKVPGVCYGIALIDDEIAVGGYGKIYIISKTGDLKNTINVEREDVHSISVGQKHQLHYAQGNIAESELKCVRLDDGKDIFISTQCTNHVIEVKADRLGNVYILEYKASNFKLFCSEDKSLKTMLTTEDGLKGRYGLAFNTDFCKLFISIQTNSANSEILVYKCN